jgi:hypothetical protein
LQATKAVQQLLPFMTVLQAVEASGAIAAWVKPPQAPAAPAPARRSQGTQAGADPAGLQQPSQVQLSPSFTACVLVHIWTRLPAMNPQQILKMVRVVQQLGISMPPVLGSALLARLATADNRVNGSHQKSNKKSGGVDAKDQRYEVSPSAAAAAQAVLSACGASEGKSNQVLPLLQARLSEDQLQHVHVLLNIK